MSGKDDWRMVYANPLIWATALGMFSSEMGWMLPTALHTSLTMIGNVLVPMMLISLGARLAGSEIQDVRVGVQSSVMMLVIRLVATFVILSFIPLQGIERGAVILFAFLPPAVFNFMLADKFQVEPNKVTSSVIVGHIFSLVFCRWTFAFASSSSPKHTAYFPVCS